MEVSVGIEERGSDKSLANRIMVRVDLKGTEELKHSDELKEQLKQAVAAVCEPLLVTVKAEVEEPKKEEVEHEEPKSE